MTFNQFLRIVRARWVLALVILLLSVFGTLGVSLLLPNTYTASAHVMADIRPDPVSFTNMQGAMASTYLATQVDVIKSSAVSQRVVRDLKLTTNPDIHARWEKATGAKGDFSNWVADLISQGLEVKPSRESSVIQIIYEGSSPEFAAGLANAYAKSYIDSTVQIKVDPARQYSDFFEERARIARDKLEKARTRLAEAQRDRGIIVTDERLDVETTRLAELSSQLTALRAIRTEADTRVTQGRTNANQMREVLSSPVVAGLKADLARQEAALEQLTKRYGDAYPAVVEARAGIESLRAKMRDETRQVTGSAGVDTTMARTREKDTESLFEAQRQRLLKLKEARTDLAVLEREVETAQRIYDSIQERLNQTTLESNTSQSGIYLLSKAEVPLRASGPRVVINTVVAFVLGTLLALMTALTVELFDRRVRSPLDIVQALDLNVIGALPAPKASKSAKRFGLLPGKSQNALIPVSNS
jgi:succinoglycan biosynthesis transport protein ExoP